MKTIKAITNILLILISTSLSINMFLSLSTTLLKSVAFAILAGAIELLKVVSLREWKEERLKPMLVGYLITLAFSILASIGYTLSAVSNISNQAEISNNLLQNNMQEIRIIDRQIKNLLILNDKYLSKTNAIYYWRTKQINKQIEKLRLEKKKLIEASKKESKQELTMFDMLAILFHLPKQLFMLIFFLSMAFAIEYGIYITTQVTDKYKLIKDFTSKKIWEAIDGERKEIN